MKKENKTYEVAIIGAGLIGISIAEHFLKKGVKSVILLEKDHQPLLETSSHNSGMIHGGFDATPGKLKAKLNFAGRKLYEELYLKENAPYDWKKINSYVLAYDQEEVIELERLYKQGIKNGLPPEDMAIIDREALKKVDPSINPKVIKAFVCYASYMINPSQFGKYLLKKAKQAGLATRFFFKVEGIKFNNKKWNIISSDNQKVSAKVLINAAGVWSEDIARLIEKKPEFKIDTRRGQYLILDKTQKKYCSENIFFLTPSKHGKGVIIAPLFDGRILVGPNAEQGVPKNDIQIVTMEGLNFVREIGHKINLNLNMNRVESVYAGSRAINIVTNDFFIKKSKKNSKLIHVAGIQSPGISSAPAIAEYVFKIFIQ